MTEINSIGNFYAPDTGGDAIADENGYSGTNSTPGTWSNAMLIQDPKNFGRPFSTPIASQSSPANPTLPAYADANMLGCKGCFVAEPIDTVSGNVFLSENDFAGAPSTQISLTRYYNSQDYLSGMFGASWRSTWERTLLRPNAGSSTVTAVRMDGKQEIFTNSGGSTYVTDTDVLDALSEVTSGGSQTGWQLLTPDDTKEDYNLTGQLTTVVTRAGLTTSLNYSTTSNQLLSVTGPFGHALAFTYTGNGNVYQVTLPDAGKQTYAYDANNNLVSVTHPDSTKRQYAYVNSSFPNLMTSLTDEDLHVYSTWTYDSSGRAINNQLAGLAESTTVSYGSTSSTVTTPLGYSTVYNFTTENKVIKPTSLTGAPTQGAGGQSFTYDSNGFVESATDWDNNVTDYAHNAMGEETLRTEAYGTTLARTTTTMWSGTWHLPTEIQEALSRTTTFSYDANGNMTGKTVTDGTHTRTWKYTYNTNGQVLGATNPLNYTTSFSYTTSGNLATIRNPLGQVTTFNSYNANGYPISLTNAAGLTTTFAYDARQRLGSVTVGGLVTTTSYDAASNKPTKITYPDASYLTFSYDTAHRLIKVADALGDTTSYIRDAASNIISAKVYNATPTLKMTTSYTYDSVNRLTSIIGASLGETTSLSYDTQGNLLKTEDPNGHYTTYTYDDLNRLATTENPYSGYTTYTYDALDDVVSIKDPLNHTTTSTWDGIGDNLTVVSPNTGTTQYSYNAAGLVLTTTDARSKTASYTYDALQRTSTISYSGGQAISYLYDTTTYGIGHLGKMVDPAGTTTWTFDKFGDVLTKSQVSNAITLTTTYGYDSFDRPSTMKYPSGKTLTYSYDTAGRLDAVTTGATSISYFPFGMAGSWTEANGSTYTRGFDEDGYITSIALASTTTNNTQTLTYDPAHNLKELQETGQSTQYYNYDSYNRLASYFNGTATSSYTYDVDSDRTTSVLGVTTTYNYTSGTNKLANLFNGTTTSAFGYDASGDMTGDGTNTWTYDSRQRMATLVAGTTTASYSVNGFGQRIVKKGSTVTNGGTNYFMYDEQGNFIGEYNSSGAIIEETEYLPNTPNPILASGLGMAGYQGMPTPIAVNTGTSGAAVASATADWRSAMHLIENSSKQRQWAWYPDPFATSGPNQNPYGLGTYTYNLRYPGQYIDAESGIDYNNQRDIYYQKLGQFGQFDPLWTLDAGRSPYGYVNANPLINTDRSGFVSVATFSTLPQTSALPGLTPSSVMCPANNPSGGIVQVGGVPNVKDFAPDINDAGQALTTPQGLNGGAFYGGGMVANGGPGYNPNFYNQLSNPSIQNGNLPSDAVNAPIILPGANPRYGQ